MSSSRTEAERQAIVHEFRQILAEKEHVESVLIDRESDLNEHKLVLKTLQAQPGRKRAWRLVGDVLIERTVEDLLPEVKENCENLTKLKESLERQAEQKKKELLEYQNKHNIKLKIPGQESGEGNPNNSKNGDGGSSTRNPAQGVLITE